MPTRLAARARAMGRWLAVVLPVVGTACATGASGPQVRSTLAPTAIVLRNGQRHIGVLDARATIPEQLCLPRTTSGSVGLLVAIDDRDASAQLVVIAPDGAVLAERHLDAAQPTATVALDVPRADRPTCVLLRATRGTTLYETQWWPR